MSQYVSNPDAGTAPAQPIQITGTALGSGQDLTTPGIPVNHQQLTDAINSERQNSLTIFGIFASLITFLGLEVQILKTAQDAFTLLGLGMFVVGCLLVFVLFVHLVARGQLDKISEVPLIWLPIILLIGGVIFLIIGAEQKIDRETSNLDISCRGSHTECRGDYKFLDY